MIAIDDILISDQIVEEQFVCDLSKCKGGCCVDGDAGAPLEKDELSRLNEIYEEVLPYVSAECRAKLKKERYVYDKEFGWVTPTIGNGMCAYAMVDKKGIVKCGIEQAYNDGKVDWKKPVSCHLFPIRIKKTNNAECLNYEPREDLCSAACTLGKSLKVPVYQFLKEAIIRKYGEEFYDALDASAIHHQTMQ